jgi:predicted PhzF superfamily epimerase YddE/YHI9
MGDTEHPCRNRDDLSWVGFERLAVTSAEAPCWLRDLLSPYRLQRCYVAGAADGYLIAELTGDSDLTTLSPPGADLAAESDRALLVVTAVDRLRLAAETLHFRYFAPQYGTSEDTATGSAMRLLGELSSDRPAVLQAIQRSPQGGLLFARCDDDYTWVGGRVEAGALARDGVGGSA